MQPIHGEHSQSPRPRRRELRDQSPGEIGAAGTDVE
jgi:hypothetical protein